MENSSIRLFILYLHLTKDHDPQIDIDKYGFLCVQMTFQTKPYF